MTVDPPVLLDGVSVNASAVYTLNGARAAKAQFGLVYEATSKQLFAIGVHLGVDLSRQGIARELRKHVRQVFAENGVERIQGQASEDGRLAWQTSYEWHILGGGLDDNATAVYNTLNSATGKRNVPQVVRARIVTNVNQGLLDAGMRSPAEDSEDFARVAVLAFPIDEWARLEGRPTEARSDFLGCTYWHGAAHFTAASQQRSDEVRAQELEVLRARYQIP